jgi:uncharacterized protein YdeI (YjbR/CyaY-like superfamily)
MRKTKTADAFFESAPRWRSELKSLRKILKSTGVTEDVKWGMPCYTCDGVNIVGLGAFKSYFGLWFFQGALLKDREKHLLNAQEGRTKAMRQWRMTSAREIDAPTIKRYVEEAVALAKAGKSVAKSPPKALVAPEELTKALAKNKKAGAAFKALTPGRQREYADYVSEAKREETRIKRVEKILPMIAAGAGLNDKYKNC